MEMNAKDIIEIILKEYNKKKNKENKWKYVTSYMVFKGSHVTDIVKPIEYGYKSLNIHKENREFCTIFTHAHRQQYETSKTNFEFIYKNSKEFDFILNSDVCTYPSYAKKEDFIENYIRRNNDIRDVVEVLVYHNESEDKICFRTISHHRLLKENRL